MTEITNARRGGAGTLIEVDEQVDSEGRRYPTAIIRASDGSLKALHFDQPGQISALAKAEPKIGDRLSLNSGLLHVDRADNYGEAGMTRPAAADWSRWANIAFHRSPESPSHLVAERPAAPTRTAPERVQREVKMPNGSLGVTFDPLPAPAQPRIVSEDGHLVSRR